MGIDCGRDRALRLMREMGIKSTQSKRFKPLKTNSKHRYGYSPSLLKNNGNPTRIDEVWVADTTYLPSKSGWLYLATVMDLFSRRLLGWSISNHNDAKLVGKALKAAAMTRGTLRIGIIHHSDRGSPYASDDYQRLVSELGMKPSMSAQGNCYDNAAMAIVLRPLQDLIALLSASEVSTKLSVNTNQLYRWKKLYLDDQQGDEASKQPSSPKEMAAEIDRLRKELRRSERINQILKKTVGYFAKDE